MPEPIVALVAAGKWHELLVLKRWYTTALCGLLRIFHAWPPRSWMDAAAPAHESFEDQAILQFHGESLGLVTQRIRRWSSILVRCQEHLAAAHDDEATADADMDKDTGTIMSDMSRTVCTLEHWRVLLRGEGATYMGRGSRMHSSSKMLKYLRCA